MCLYVIKRNSHTGARVGSPEYKFCPQSDGIEPCSNVRSREELIGNIPVSALSSPGLVPHDGVSTVSSSMPGTPVSATSGYNYENRVPSLSPSGRGKKKYRPYLEIPLLPGRDSRRRSPVVSQPNPPSPLGLGGRRSALPEGFRTNHMRAHSDSEYDNSLSSPRRAEERATEILDRGHAREQQRREERQRKRDHDQRRQQQTENEAEQRQAQRDDRAAQRRNEEEERMLDQQELRDQARLNAREQLREDARRKREEQERRQSGSETEPERPTRNRQEDEARRRREAAEREQVERLRQQILAGRAEEQRLRRERDQRLRHRQEAESARLAEEQRRRDMSARIELEERRLADLEARLAAETAREAARQRAIRRAEQHFEELDRRVRESEARGGGRLDGPRFGERRNIAAAAPEPFLEASLYEHAEFRRRRGEEVLDRDRREARDWDADEAGLRGPALLMSRRRTIGGRERGRETRYRDSMRNYPC